MPDVHVSPAWLTFVFERERFFVDVQHLKRMVANFIFDQSSFKTLNKIIPIIIFLFISGTAIAQNGSAIETVKNYSIAQKRLLVKSTFQFANSITQNNLDQDRVMNMALHITGMPFLLPYNETFPGGQVTALSNFVNTGLIDQAKHTLKSIDSAQRIQGLLEVALWYLHRDGTHRQDLDSAAKFIQLALTASHGTGNLLSAELEYQLGNIEQSQVEFSRLAVSALQEGKTEITARAYTRMADLLWVTDTTKEKLYFKSLDIYRSLGLKEKQIELLWKIESCHEHRNFYLAQKDLCNIIDIANEIGFKHTLYAKNRLAYVLLNTGDYLSVMEYARAALDNMKWSGLTKVQGTFYIRMGQAYGSFGKNDEFFQWFNKALITGTRDSHLFWYKAIPMLTGILCDMNKPAAALSMIDRVTSKFPPVTVWEKIQLLALFGVCYEKLNKPKLADKYFKQLIELATANPLADPFGEMSGDYIMISQLYVLRGDLKLGRIFLKLGRINERKSPEALSLKYSLYYKMDSLQGNYRLALQNYIKYKIYYDSATGINQRKKMDELTLKYAAEKKDQDIMLLKEQGISQKAELQQNKLTKKIMMAGAGMLLIIGALLYSQFKLKQRANAIMNVKNLALQSLLNEKEWLLKEVHHRVKNNLHTVISLLESQASYLENDALKAIEKSQHRIYAMSLIHQKLYQAEDIKTIDMSVYLPEFINYLDDSFGTHDHINFQLSIEPLKFGVSQAIPMALIINEALTNSIKYAFPGNTEGMIMITLNRVADRVKLIIADNGIGMDHSFVHNAPGTLGLKLIRGLSEDIQGNVTITNDDGTKITIVFNANPWHESPEVLTALN